MEKIDREEMIIQEWLIQEPVLNKPRRKYGPKPMKQRLGEIIKVVDE